jgi:hypothetical protein
MHQHSRLFIEKTLLVERIPTVVVTPHLRAPLAGWRRGFAKV